MTRVVNHAIHVAAVLSQCSPCVVSAVRHRMVASPQEGLPSQNECVAAQPKKLTERFEWPPPASARVHWQGPHRECQTFIDSVTNPIPQAAAPANASRG